MLSRRALESTQPPIQLESGILTPAIKWQDREAGHSPPTSTEGKKTWNYTLTPPYTFMA
jgi:hypothetical protein